MSEHSDEWYQNRYGWEGGKVKSEIRKRKFGEVLTPRRAVADKARLLGTKPAR